MGCQTYPHCAQWVVSPVFPDIGMSRHAVNCRVNDMDVMTIDDMDVMAIDGNPWGEPML